jgi:hypothetical protein
VVKNLFEAFAGSLIRRGVKAIVDRALKKIEPSPKPPSRPVPPAEKPKAEEPKVHPWRLCPVGEHWVRVHEMRVAVSDAHPDGKTIRRTGCRNNPVRGKKKSVIQDYLHPDEIQLIAEERFSDLTGPPASGKLSEFGNSDKYDDLIRGWAKYWNEVLQPADPLDPDLVKALIASESGFRIDPEPRSAGAGGEALGLMQLTEQTVKALGNPEGELKGKHLVKISKAEARDANIAICAGIRWLFYKRQRASVRLKREATWMEGVAEYKSYLKDIQSGKNPNPDGMRNIEDKYGKQKP